MPRLETLVFATTNQGKLAELRALVGTRIKVLSARDFSHVGEVDEDGATFEANAEKKARTYAQASGHWALADDSGLCVDALGGAPGVHSARYAADDAQRIQKLLGALAQVPDAQRSAHFVCVLCLASPSGDVVFTRGECRGRIVRQPRGAHGFGYDPIFEVADGRTLAELTRDEKSAVSHRGFAFAQLKGLLES